MTETIAELLVGRAARTPDRLAFTWLEDGEREAGGRTFGELDRRARAVAGRVAEVAAPGARALLVFDQGMAFIDALFGCLYAGVVPVPTAAEYVRPDAALARLEPIVLNAAPSVLVTDGSGAVLAALRPESGLSDAAPVAAALPRLDIGEIAVSELGRGPVRRGPAELAFLQYTSGSTMAPRGVMISHGNLIANLESVSMYVDDHEDAVRVSWLPMFHDFGLVGLTLLTVFTGNRCVMMSPVAFVLRPQRWLEAITRYRASLCGAPNFAFDLCVRRIPEHAREGLELSLWRRAFCGGEPVHADTLERFVAAFGPHGFDGRAFDPVYGLAETTLFAAGPGSDGVRTVTIDTDALQRDHVELVSDGGAGRRIVSVGRAVEGVTIRIVEPDSGEPLGEGRVGEIWIAGPNVAGGYWESPEETAATFGQPVAGEAGPFVRSGDLGFIHDGDLYITGRIKDLIIVRGRNHHPHDLELTAQRSHPGLRPGGGAAFSLAAGEERVVLVHEIRPNYAEAIAEISQAATRAIAREHGVTLHELICIAPGELRKTTSGKTMRHAIREDYLAGRLPGKPSAAGAAARPRAAHS